MILTSSLFRATKIVFSCKPNRTSHCDTVACPTPSAFATVVCLPCCLYSSMRMSAIGRPSRFSISTSLLGLAIFVLSSLMSISSISTYVIQCNNQFDIELNWMTEEDKMSKQAERIRNLRSQLGLSQDELAEVIGVSQRQLSRYEVGVAIPSDVLLRMAEVLNVNTDYLLGRIDDPTPYGQNDGLAPDERKAIAAWRGGDKMEAVRIIVNG